MAKETRLTPYTVPQDRKTKAMILMRAAADKVNEEPTPESYWEIMKILESASMIVQAEWEEMTGQKIEYS